MQKLILTLPIFLTACLRTEYVEVSPDIPTETLTPCPLSDRTVETYRELAVLATEHLNTARCANGKIEAVAEILNTP